MSSVRNTHPEGILQVNPNAGLRYTPALTLPGSSGETADNADLLTCLDDWEEEDEEEGREDCADVRAKQLKR